MHFLIVDDHPLYREAMQSTVRLAFSGAIISEAESIDQAAAILERRTGVDLILLDLSMRGLSGFEGLMTIRKSFPSVPILVVSGLDDLHVIQSVKRCGAAGFVGKALDKATLIEAISTVLHGSIYFPDDIGAASQPTRPSNDGALLIDRIAQLTPQQLRVLKMIRQGKLNKQIAHELVIGDSTVKAHVSEILRKLGVMSRTQIVIKTVSLNFDQPA